MHYHRLYRHGDVNKVARGRREVERYAHKQNPSHPLAMANGFVYVHRATLFDAIGEGPQACHWCERELQWSLPKGDPAALQVDHLDGNRRNNELSNLVPSCRRCNVGRGQAERYRRMVADGYWSGHDTVAALGDRWTVDTFG